MVPSDLTQVAATALAIALLAGLAAWLKIGGPPAPLDEARARILVAEAFPGRRVDAIWVGVAGRGALAKSGAAALVLCQLGQGFTVRQMPWATALAAAFKTGRLCVDLADVDAPVAEIRVSINPPADLPRAA
jgi:hypothetical protein